MIHKYLAYLKTIETGSITQAAAELGYTQSAVSRMIADLEEHWDVPLLTRNRSGIEISSEGTQLLPILQSIVKGQEELSFAVGELHGLQSGLIRVGAFTSMATGWCHCDQVLPQKNTPISAFRSSTASTTRSRHGYAAGRSTAAFSPSPAPRSSTRPSCCATR